MKQQGKGKTECGIVAKQRTQRNSTRKNCHPKLFKEKKMTIRIQAKPRKEKQTRKEERKPKQSKKTMKPCKAMQSKGMKGKPKSKAKHQKNNKKK